MLFPVHKQIHGLIEVYCACDHAANMENLMRGSEFVKHFWEVFLREPENIQKGSSNVKEYTQNPRKCAVQKNVTFVSIQKLVMISKDLRVIFQINKWNDVANTKCDKKSHSKRPEFRFTNGWNHNH